MENNTKYSGNLFPLYLKRKRYFKIFSMCLYKLDTKYYDYKKCFISIGDVKFKIKFYLKKGIKIGFWYFNIYSSKIEYDKLKSLPIQNELIYHFIGKKEICIPFLYNIIFRNFSIGNHSRVYNYDDINLCTYLRQARGNKLGLSVRDKNITDNKFWQLLFAYILSLFSFRSKIILLYEKNCEKYEESASVVYEKLIDNNKKAYFILNENSKHWCYIKEKYRKNIIKAHSFKHYYYYFKCKKFISSESIPHALEVRCINRFVNVKLFLRRFKYVFLQHGVMYMVSLDSNTRSFFRKGNEMSKYTKVVVSSNEEANHFIELGGYSLDDLYICGLPQYDRIKKNKDANKIVIMPTWRPWDFNVLESNYRNSSYYKMIIDILNGIPEQNKNNIWILPHPLIKEKLEQTDLKKYIPKELSYDKVLEKTDLLITDYSSISYSAFYRGSNVIFYWKDLEECMEHYQAHLMLNKDNVFGDICMDTNEIKLLIKANYMKNQKEKHVKNYKKIVEFNDNKNTERLYSFLIKDKFFD